MFIIIGCIVAQQSSVITWSTYISVRDITKSNSTFSATNISSYIISILKLHDIIQIKSNYTWINYNHENIAMRSHIIINESLWNLVFAAKFSNIYLAKREKRLFFRLPFVNLQRAKYGANVFDAKHRYVLVAQISSIARLVSHLINYFSKWMSTM